MIFSDMTCKVWNGKRSDSQYNEVLDMYPNITLSSKMFPLYLPVSNNLFPTFEELVTESSDKFESATKTDEYISYYYMARRSVFPDDMPDGLDHGFTREPEYFSFQIKNEYTNETIHEISMFSTNKDDFKVNLPVGASYKAIYRFCHSQDPDTDTLHFIAYTYTFSAVENHLPLFDYRIELHYSQTNACHLVDLEMFDYRIELHYSQTYFVVYPESTEFDYRIELHYSQTLI